MCGRPIRSGSLRNNSALTESRADWWDDTRGIGQRPDTIVVKGEQQLTKIDKTRVRETRFALGPSFAVKYKVPKYVHGNCSDHCDE